MSLGENVIFHWLKTFLKSVELFRMYPLQTKKTKTDTLKHFFIINNSTLSISQELYLYRLAQNS